MKNKVKIGLSFKVSATTEEEANKMWDFIIKEMRKYLNDNKMCEYDFLEKYFENWEDSEDWFAKDYTIYSFVTEWFNICKQNSLYTCLINMFNKYEEKNKKGEKVPFLGMKLIQLEGYHKEIKKSWGDTSKIKLRSVKEIEV